MHDGARHSPHDFLRHRSLLGEIDDSGDAAHSCPVIRIDPAGDRFVVDALFCTARKFSGANQATRVHR